MEAFPVEIYPHIGSWMHDRDLCGLLTVNRAFYHLAMEARYGSVVIGRLNLQTLHLLEHLHDPQVGAYVHKLTLRPHLPAPIARRNASSRHIGTYVDYLLKAILSMARLNECSFLPSGAMDQWSDKVLARVISSLCQAGLRILSVNWSRPLSGQPSDALAFLPIPCSGLLTELDLSCHGGGIENRLIQLILVQSQTSLCHLTLSRMSRSFDDETDFLGDFPPLPSLDALTFKIAFLNHTSGSIRGWISSLSAFLSRHVSTLESLKVTLHRCEDSEIEMFLTSLPRFSKLRCLDLHLGWPVSPVTAVFDVIRGHGQTLDEVALQCYQYRAKHSLPQLRDTLSILAGVRHLHTLCIALEGPLNDLVRLVLEYLPKLIHLRIRWSAISMDLLELQNYEPPTIPLPPCALKKIEICLSAYSNAATPSTMTNLVRQTERALAKAIPSIHAAQSRCARNDQAIEPSWLESRQAPSFYLEDFLFLSLEESEWLTK